jgi:carbon-monoxide dehydrogenase small subunit
MSAADLLERTPDPDREEIESAISGNVCRCTGYRSIVDSIEAAAAIMDEDADTPPGGPDRAAEDSGGDQA